MGINALKDQKGPLNIHPFFCFFLWNHLPVVFEHDCGWMTKRLCCLIHPVNIAKVACGHFFTFATLLRASRRRQKFVCQSNQRVFGHSDRTTGQEVVGERSADCGSWPFLLTRWFFRAQDWCLWQSVWHILPSGCLGTGQRAKDEAILAEYNQGASYKELQETFGLSKMSVWRRLKK